MTNAMSEDPLFMSQGSSPSANSENKRAKTAQPPLFQPVIPSEDTENERIMMGSDRESEESYPNNSTYPGNELFPTEGAK